MKKIVLLALSATIVLSTVAQTGISNNGNMQLHTGSAVSSSLDFTNNAATALINN